MSKELPYFRFTAFEWLNDDISLEDYSIKGLFADICAYYWFKDCSLTLAKLELRFSNAIPMIKTLLISGIIKHDENTDFVQILFLNKQYDELSELRRIRQDAGAKGGKQKASKAKAKLKQKASYKDKDKDKDKDKNNTKTWREDFSIYLGECKAAYKVYFENKELMKDQARLNPGINVPLSIEKGFKTFWGTEAGWRHKKKSRAVDIDWRATITNSIGINKVYYTKEELAKQ